jgi:hypothetical protein
MATGVTTWRATRRARVVRCALLWQVQRMSRPVLLSLSAALLGAVGAVVGVVGAEACAPDASCQCFACENAISLFVVDGSGAAVTDGWAVEATLDGVAVDTSACAPGVRTSNQCAFGTDSGVYEIVVQTPSEEKHVNGRAAATGGVDCCLGACLPTENIPVVLGVQQAPDAP